jgi:hypothetical protein
MTEATTDRDVYGLIWLSTPRYTVGLIVEAGRVVDCPPLVRRWAYGKFARDVWIEAKRRGARLEWLPRITPV